MSSEGEAPAIEVRGLAKSYPDARVSTVESSLKDQLTTMLLAPWRILAPFRRRTGSTIHALHPVDLIVPKGQKVGIIGRNGSGKSTLLKLLSRITFPTAGEAVIRGRTAAILEVGTGFHPDLTGHENIFLNGAILGLRRQYIQDHFQEIIDFADIGDFLDVPVKRYSSGMRVRLAFSVAAHIDADVLLVDEVLAVGDRAFRHKCLRRMEDEVAKGRTVLLVSHSMDAIRSFCDRVVHIADGRIDYDGDPGIAIQRYEERCRAQAGASTER